MFSEPWKSYPEISLASQRIVLLWILVQVPKKRRTTMIWQEMIHTNPILQAEVQDWLVFEHIVSGGDRMLTS